MAIMMPGISLYQGLVYIVYYPYMATTHLYPDMTLPGWFITKTVPRLAVAPFRPVVKHTSTTRPVEPHLDELLRWRVRNDIDPKRVNHLHGNVC